MVRSEGLSMLSCKLERVTESSSMLQLIFMVKKALKITNNRLYMVSS